jgi:hypothetical protein
MRYLSKHWQMLSSHCHTSPAHGAVWLHNHPMSGEFESCWWRWCCVVLQAHSPDSSDMLPGLYTLSQAWLQEAVVAGFRPDALTGQTAADLGQWFAARKVQLYIQASEW